MGNVVAIKCQGIKKHYGEAECRIEALKSVDLEILEGELTLLVGPSGSGKSTLLSIMTMILTPDAGELVLLGQDIHNMTEDEKSLFRRKYLGVVYQSLFLIPTLTVLENVSLPLLISGVSQKIAEERSMEALKKMDMAHRCDSLPTQLSRGQQQRVAIGRAIVNDSKILVCDEPTSSLDQTSGLSVMHLLHDLAKESRTIFVVTHDHRTFPFADRIVNINDGIITKGNMYE